MPHLTAKSSKPRNLGAVAFRAPHRFIFLDLAAPRNSVAPFALGRDVSRILNSLGNGCQLVRLSHWRLWSWHPVHWLCSSGFCTLLLRTKPAFLSSSVSFSNRDLQICLRSSLMLPSSRSRLLCVEKLLFGWFRLETRTGGVVHIQSKSAIPLT